MSFEQDWDWDVGKKLVADPTGLAEQFPSVHEPIVSPNGERFAVAAAEGETARVWADGELWEEEYEKAWHLLFSPDGRLTALVRVDDMWTVAVDGKRWDSEWEYAWETRFTPDGSAIGVQVKEDMEYAVAVNGEAWETKFPSIRGFSLSDDGKTAAAVVQVEGLDEADIFAFSEGVWSVAVNGEPWSSKYISVYSPTVSPDGSHVAAEVRTDMYEYTIAEDGEPWKARFNCVWEPVFRDSGKILAPARISGAWTMAEAGKQIWKGSYVQLWLPRLSPDGKRVAAVVASSFGRWTIAVDDAPWADTVSDAAFAPVFSRDGRRVAAIGKDANEYALLLDGRLLPERYDMMWDPVFSSNGEFVAAKVEKGGKYGVAINGKLGKQQFDAMWDPVFSPDDSALLIRAMEGGKYYRHVIPVKQVLG